MYPNNRWDSLTRPGEIVTRLRRRFALPHLPVTITGIPMGNNIHRPAAVGASPAGLFDPYNTPAITPEATFVPGLCKRGGLTAAVALHSRGIAGHWHGPRLRLPGQVRVVGRTGKMP